jgi:Rrf2 family iron-sulfur cluster assembly transcriptional regulator
MKLVDSAIRASTNAMLCLALAGRKRPVPLAWLAQRTGTSVSYLEQLFSGLRAAGLVQAVRGPGGGYLLAGPAESISVAAIAAAMARMRPRGVTAATEAAAAHPGRLHSEVWADCEAHAIRWLSGVTLADLSRDHAPVARVPGVGAAPCPDGS